MKKYKMCPKCGVKMKKGTTQELEKHLFEKPKCRWTLKISGFVKKRVFKKFEPIARKEPVQRTKPIEKPQKATIIRTKDELDKAIKDIEKLGD